MRAELSIWEKTTQVYHHLRRTKHRVVVAQGGGQSSKTISILQFLGDIAISEPRVTISIFGMTYDHLRRDAMRNFKNLIATNEAFAFFIENPEAKEGPFQFKNGSIIEFIALDNPVKALGAKREYSYFNEANAINYETYERIYLRTSKRVFIDYNPTAQFWVHERVLPFKDVAYGFISTFMDNDFCPPEAAATLKGYFLKWKQTGSEYWKNHWRVYGLGQTGVPEGVVFPDVKIIDKFPEIKELRHFGYAVDWGFAQDPTTVLKCGIKLNGEFVGQELFYETGINAYSFDELFPTLGLTKNDPIIADGANLDAIDWLAKRGWNIMPADKPPGSVRQGIELLNQIGINIVQGSENWIKEQGLYVYKTKMGAIDKDEPVDKSNHCWDAARYFAKFAVLNKGVNPRKVKTGKRKFYVG